MATIKGTDTFAEGGYELASWSGFVASADVGTSVGITKWPDRTVQVYGSFGTSLAITIEGTNDPAEGASNWNTLHDFLGNAIVLTDNSLKLIAENPLRIRPRATAGSGGNVTVVITGVRGSV